MAINVIPCKLLPRALAQHHERQPAATLSTTTRIPTTARVEQRCIPTCYQYRHSPRLLASVGARKAIADGAHAERELVDHIGTIEEWEELLEHQPEDQLTVLEVTSMNVCEDGLEEEPELYWEGDKRAQLEKCADLSAVFANIAADCPDIKFVLANVYDKDDPLCRELGLDVLPTVQFYRGSRRLWEHRGVLALQQDIAEGVLYYGDTAAHNEKASSSVQPLQNMEELQQFVHSQPENVLTVVNVSVDVCEPCMHVFPVVVALAKAFKGYAAFGRLHLEESDQTAALFAALRVEEVPAFIFYRSGREVGRFVGSQKGDLIGQILRIQDAAGVKPPPPPGSAAAARAKRLNGVRPPPPSPPPPPPQRFRARPKPSVEA